MPVPPQQDKSGTSASVAADGAVEQAAGGTSVVTRQLHKRFVKAGHEIQVLRGIDLELRRGERAAVLGPSGSGKSTFLHVLGTLDKPSSGEVILSGVDAFSGGSRAVDARRNREIGFVFQFHHLLSHLTALQNVTMPAIISGMSVAEANERGTGLLCRLMLSDRLTHRPGELSGGEQQRVAIARAMVMRPGLLLADEPTGNLDPRTAGAVFDELLALHEEVGCTLLVVTHSRRLATHFPRRLRLNDGLFEEAA